MLDRVAPWWPRLLTASMLVAVVDIRVVRVLVRHHDMLMRMVVRLLAAPVEVVHMLMVRVMYMAMLVLQCLMFVLVLMPLGQMQPHAGSHQRTGQPEGQRGGLAQQQDSQRGADERRGREVGAGTRRTQAA